MRTAITAIVVLAAVAAIIFTSAPLHAAGPVSANNFTCTATPANGRNLIECIGTLPGATGLFGGTGYDLVHVAYSPDNQKKYTYMSDTGCLILTAPDKSAYAVSAAKKEQKFASFLDAMGWCYKGGN